MRSRLLNKEQKDDPPVGGHNRESSLPAGWQVSLVSKMYLGDVINSGNEVFFIWYGIKTNQNMDVK
jgi:hypothetical protein